MKQKILREIESFVNLLHMSMKIGAAEFAQKNFKKLIDEQWDDSKTDEENLKNIKDMFELNKNLNNTPAGNPEAAKVIEIFQEGWLNKL